MVAVKTKTTILVNNYPSTYDKILLATNLMQLNIKTQTIIFSICFDWTKLKFYKETLTKKDLHKSVKMYFSGKMA